MHTQHERGLRRLLGKLAGLRQGLHPKHGGGRLRAFCEATGRRYSSTVNKLNAGGARASRFLASLDVPLVVDLCLYFRSTRPVDFLARIVRAHRGRRAAQRMEVAA